MWMQPKTGFNHVTCSRLFLKEKGPFSTKRDLLNFISQQLKATFLEDVHMEYALLVPLK